MNVIDLPHRHIAGLAFASVVWFVFATPVYAQKPQPTTSSKSESGKSDSGNGILPGSSSKDPVNIDAAKLDYYDKEQKLVYTGNVVAVQGESRLLTPSLVIFLMPKETATGSGPPSSTNNQVRRMEASGPVTLTQKDQVGTGDSGVYIKAENKVYLYGNVTLTQGPNVTKGDKLVYDLNTSQAVVSGNGPGRVKSLFVPANDDKDSGSAAAKDSGPKDSGSKKTGKSAGSSQNDAAFKIQ